MESPRNHVKEGKTNFSFTAGDSRRGFRPQAVSRKLQPH